MCCIDGNSLLHNSIAPHTLHIQVYYTHCYLSIWNQRERNLKIIDSFNHENTHDKLIKLLKQQNGIDGHNSVQFINVEQQIHRETE